MDRDLCDGWHYPAFEQLQAKPERGAAKIASQEKTQQPQSHILAAIPFNISPPPPRLPIEDLENWWGRGASLALSLPISESLFS